MTQKIDPQFNEWLLKERLGNSLAARFVLRFHASLLLMAGILAGWIVNRLLFMAGLESMIPRHVLAVLAAYGGFLIALQFWIEYSGIKEYLNNVRSKELLAGSGRVDEKGSSVGDIATGLPVDGEGCAVLLLVAAAFVIFYFLGGYLVVHATGFFSEVVFELLLAGGLIKGIRKVDLLGTQGRVPMVTLWALAATLLFVVLVGLWAHHAHPDAKTIRELIPVVRSP